MAFEKLLKNGIFSFRQPRSTWGGGEQESNHRPLPPCISPHSTQEGASPDHRVGRRSQKRPTSGQDLGRKRGGEQAGLGGPRGDPGRASARLPRICLQRSNYAPVAASPCLRRPPRSPYPPSAPCIPAGCRARGPYGGNNKTINFPLKNNICGFLERRAAAIPTQRHISHARPPPSPPSCATRPDHLHGEMRGRRWASVGGGWSRGGGP